MNGRYIPMFRNNQEEYRKAFAYFDANQDGCITLEEMESAMNKCGIHPTKIELRIIMSQGDRDKNGVITFDEFAVLMRTQEQLQMSQHQRLMASSATTIHSKAANGEQNGHYRPDHVEIKSDLKRELMQQFRMFDKDDDGYILPEEMGAIVKELQLGQSFPQKVLDQLFNEADTDGDGKISFEEFVMAVI